MTGLTASKIANCRLNQAKCSRAPPEANDNLSSVRGQMVLLKMEAKYEKLCLASLFLLEAALYQLLLVLFLQEDHRFLKYCISLMPESGIIINPVWDFCKNPTQKNLYFSPRVADPAHFRPDPNTAIQNFTDRIRILLVLTKNQFKHNIFFHINHISSDIWMMIIFIWKKWENSPKNVWKLHF